MITIGISKYAASVLMAETKKNPFKGSVLQLGKQDIWFDFATLQKIAKRYKYELEVPKKITLSHKEDLSSKNFIDDICFFQTLGLTTVSSLDLSDYESADIILDLNTQETPENLLNSFDLIIDGGTIEHIFHLPNAMKHIVNMLKVGGRVIHLSPSSNTVDHGFYMFSPTFFMDYYSANRFEINTINLYRFFWNFWKTDTGPWDCYNYTPNCLNSGDLDGAMYGVLCIATKTNESTNNVIPQQGAFLPLWNNHKNNQNLEVKDTVNDKIQINTCVNVLKDHTPKRLYPFMRLAYSIIHKMALIVSEKCYGKRPNLKLNDEIKWD